MILCVTMIFITKYPMKLEINQTTREHKMTKQTIKFKDPIENSAKLSQILSSLSQFTGTAQYHKGMMTVNYTDGIKHLIKLAECNWLVEDISIVSKMRFQHIPFQIWTLQVQDGEGILTMKEDTNEPVLYRQEYSYTDFPEGTLKLYLIDGVMLLPSEY